MASTGKFNDYTHIVPAIKMFGVNGTVVGDFTITGITTDDKLLGVTAFAYDGTGDITSSLNLLSEFTITAANTINNAGGTTTTDMGLLVLYADYDA